VTPLTHANSLERIGVEAQPLVQKRVHLKPLENNAEFSAHSGLWNGFASYSYNR